MYVDIQIDDCDILELPKKLPKNAPSILLDQLSSLFRYYLIHGHINELLMTSTLIPIPKDKLGDACSSENYRSIAISSMILKNL